jgi:chromosomal replication initiation ATPase DnaA
MTTEELILKIKEKSRCFDSIVYRQCFMYLLFENFGLSYYRIGKIISLDTDTVRNACKKFKGFVEVNDKYAQIALKEFDKHEVDTDLVNIYIDKINICNYEQYN